jgi:hypothetical protein
VADVRNNWRVYSSAEQAALPRWSIFTDDPAERRCPVCGAVAVRVYMYPSDRNGRPTLISYNWCSNCHRFAGWTAPKPAGLELTDPLDSLSHAERLELEGDQPAFLERLDLLWDGGDLPQRFISRPHR